ncbi:hypothetical protein DOTSEDRAFT_70657 [Dothistroma septosporum NZE10]|uniref:Secreted protein n=1 Tax=Dothistroma septosporum (strain NZE10 / CBS 128990) TaxID=675120 RepID=N1PWY6_DOTSN|nr:hypothetical protein DOTSEDRAFT_70657 [Dothistroma septosporum NZE10]
MYGITVLPSMLVFLATLQPQAHGFAVLRTSFLLSRFPTSAFRELPFRPELVSTVAGLSKWECVTYWSPILLPLGWSCAQTAALPASRRLRPLAITAIWYSNTLFEPSHQDSTTLIGSTTALPLGRSVLLTGSPDGTVSADRCTK